MSRTRTHVTSSRTNPSFDEDVDKKMRSFAEDEASSDSDDGLDILESTKKGLNLSQYIDGRFRNFFRHSSFIILILTLTSCRDHFTVSESTQEE